MSCLFFLSEGYENFQWIPEMYEGDRIYFFKPIWTVLWTYDVMVITWNYVWNEESQCISYVHLKDA